MASHSSQNLSTIAPCGRDTVHSTQFDIPTRSTTSNNVSFNSIDDKDLENAVDRFLHGIIEDIATREQRVLDNIDPSPPRSPRSTQTTNKPGTSKNTNTPQDHQCNNDLPELEAPQYQYRFLNYMAYLFPHACPRTARQIKDDLQLEINTILAE